MTTVPRFSVVVPTRGVSSFLMAALESALASSESIEVLVVHDPGPPPPLPPALARDPRLRFVAGANPTPGAKRNDGIERARAPWIAFLDDDDVWRPGHLPAARARLEADPEISATSCDAWIFADPDAAGSAVPGDPEASLPRFWPRAADADVRLRDLILDNPILTPTVVARREALVDAGLFDPGLPVMEDWDLWLRVVRRGRWRAIAEAHVVVRRRPASASEAWRAMATCALRVLDRQAALGLPPEGPAPAELEARRARLWRELAWSCLVEDDPAAARAAARQAIARLPLAPRSYMYWLASRLPRSARQWLVAGARRRIEIFARPPDHRESGS